MSAVPELPSLAAARDGAPARDKRHEPWTDKEIRRAAELLAGGMSSEEAGRALGRSPGAVRQKAYRDRERVPARNGNAVKHRAKPQAAEPR